MSRSSATPHKPSAWLWIAAGVLLGLGVGLVGMVVLSPAQTLLKRPVSSVIRPSAPQVNTIAPDFSLQTLDGRVMTLADLRGKAVLLNFWATWCGPCRLEMPLLQEVQDRNADRLLVLAINNAEAPDVVQAFVDELGLRFGVLRDPDGQVVQRYRVRGFPTSVIIDSNGVIRYQHIGVLSQETLNGYLADLGVKQ